MNLFDISKLSYKDLTDEMNFTFPDNNKCMSCELNMSPDYILQLINKPSQQDNTPINEFTKKFRLMSLRLCKECERNVRIQSILL